MRRLPDVATLRAAAWTYRALRRARRQLRRSGFDQLALPPPPRLPASAERGVNAVLRREPSTCLERALVLQRWHAEHGRPLDVIVGVAGGSGDFQAHAWLENEPGGGARYAELRRVKP